MSCQANLSSTFLSTIGIFRRFRGGEDWVSLTRESIMLSHIPVLYRFRTDLISLIKKDRSVLHVISSSDF